MNERIRELLVKAGVIEHHFNPLAYEQWYLDALEKFAELIVRECIDIAIAEEGSAPYQGPVESEIRKHFGVEE